MGTRGACGFVSKNKEYILFNMYDSYPEVLGLSVLKFIKECDLSILPSTLQSLEVVNQNDIVPINLVRHYKKYSFDISDNLFDSDQIPSETPKGNQKIDNFEECTWYNVLREFQGQLNFLFDKEVPIKHWPDGSGILENGLFCEFAYIINIDTQKLEFYTNEKRKNSIPGRYDSGGVFLQKEIPLSKIKLADYLTFSFFHLKIKTLIPTI